MKAGTNFVGGHVPTGSGLRGEPPNVGSGVIPPNLPRLTQQTAAGIARKHAREAEGKRDMALAENNTHAALIYTRQAEIAEAIAREIEAAS